MLPRSPVRQHQVQSDHTVRLQHPWRPVRAVHPSILHGKPEVCEETLYCSSKSQEDTYVLRNCKAYAKQDMLVLCLQAILPVLQSDQVVESLTKSLTGSCWL